MNGIVPFYQRLKALITKESHQLLRDKSSLMIGLILPLILILLFGYGLSFDLNNGRVGIVVQHSTPQSQQLISGLKGTTYLSLNQYLSFREAEEAIRRAEIDAIVQLPSNFSTQSSDGNAVIQVITSGRNTNIASALQNYILGSIMTMQNIEMDRQNLHVKAGNISIEQRMWFNESGNSTWFIVPGLIVLILTLIGAFLTGLLIARERERGTLEVLFVTPVRPLEIVLAKLIPYTIIGMIDIIICLLAAYFLFEIPMQASLFTIISASFFYLIVSLLMGLTISGYAKSQFQASQMALLISFMPAMMLSGFVFDTVNLPFIVQIVSQILPATHFMTLIKTLFLGGDDSALWLKECMILVLYILLFTVMSCRSLQKRL